MADNDKSGWIYVLDDQLGHYKIGKTRHLSERIKQLKIQLPYKVSIVAVLKVADCHTAEALLHKDFQHCRVNGEWFAMQTDDLGNLWDYLRQMDGSFSLRNLFNSDGEQLSNFGWWAAGEMSAMRDGASAILYQFRMACLDNACDDFGMPRTVSTEDFLCPLDR